MLFTELQSIPIMSYTFISLTSVILAYVTLMDTNVIETPASTSSATSMLPALPAIESLNPFGSKQSTTLPTALSSGTSTTNTTNTTNSMFSLPVANPTTNTAATGLPEAPVNKIFGGRTRRQHKNKTKVAHKKTRTNHKDKGPHK